MERLGEVTSGTWRALSRELVAAAERLEGQVEEHLDDVSRRAKGLDVAPAAVLAAGAAAGHLAEHRETLEHLLPGLQGEVRRLAAPDVLLGFSVDDAVLLEDDELEKDEFDTDDDDDMEEAEDEAGDDGPPLAIDVWLFMWPAPLSPARVRIVPDIAAVANDTASDLSISFGVSGDESIVEALSSSCGVVPEDLLPALSALGLACWSAHQADDHGEEEDDDTE
jgi:hypothetical protein